MAYFLFIVCSTLPLFSFFSSQPIPKALCSHYPCAQFPRFHLQNRLSPIPSNSTFSLSLFYGLYSLSILPNPFHPFCHRLLAQIRHRTLLSPTNTLDSPLDMPSLFQSPSKMSLKDVKAPFKKRRLSTSFISPPIPVSSLPSDPPANHAELKVNGNNQGWKDDGTWEKLSEIIKLGPASPPPLPPKSPSPPPVPPKSPPLPLPAPSQSKLPPQPSYSPEKSLPRSPTKNFIIKMVAKSVSMPSLHSTANLRGNENAVRRMRPIEEAEAKGKGHVKNNGRSKYKDKNAKESSSKAPDGSKRYHRWKKKEKTKPTPKSQEKEKSPKQGILKFGKKGPNPSLNSNSKSEMMEKKESQGKVVQEVPRKVRFHHVPPTPPVSGSSNDSSDTKRSRGGNATVSTGKYTGFSSFPQPTFPSRLFNFFFFFRRKKAEEFRVRIVKVSNPFRAVL